MWQIIAENNSKFISPFQKYTLLHSFSEHTPFQILIDEQLKKIGVNNE